MEKLRKRTELANGKDSLKNLKNKKPIKLESEISKNKKTFSLIYDRLVPVFN